MQDNEKIEETTKQPLEPTPETSTNSLRVWEEKEITLTRTKTIRRLSFKNLFLEIANAFNLHEGFLRTISGLTIHPSKTIKSYIDTERDLITSPIKYFLIVASATLLLASVTNYFHLSLEFTDGFRRGMEIGSGGEEMNIDKDAITKEFEAVFYKYFIGYFNVWTMITILFTSAFSFRFFRKSKYNFVEHFAINTYLYAHSYILFFLIILFHLLHPYWTFVYMLYYMILSIIVYKQLFQRSWWTTIWKYTLAYIISMILFYIVMIGAMLSYFILFVLEKS